MGVCICECYLVDLQFGPQVGVDLFQEVDGSAGDVVAALDDHLDREHIRPAPPQHTLTSTPYKSLSIHNNTVTG